MTTIIQDPPQAVAVLRQASRLAVRELGLLSPTVASSSCSPTECHTLIEIGRTGHLTAGELSLRLALDKSTVSRVVARLADRGLVAVGEDRGDQRLKPLVLTAEGQLQLARIDQESNAQVVAALALLAPEQRRTVVEGLSLYAKALSRSRRQQELTIRLIEPADSPAMARIIRSVMGEFEAVGEGYSINDPEVDDMAGAYSGERATYFVVSNGPRVVGGGGVGPLDGADADTCELRKMYLLPEVRGLGMGRRLLARCLEAAQDLGYRRCYLETLGHMSQAQALYEANGFVATDAPMGNTGHFACNRFYVKPLDGL
jgi:putative acetyltransferase